MQTATRSTWAGDEGFRDPSRHPPLAEDRNADVAVVGAGITGLTTALLLARSGLRVAVLERDRVGSGTTGRSTGHLTAALDLSFAQLVSRFGAERRADRRRVGRALDRARSSGSPREIGAPRASGGSRAIASRRTPARRAGWRARPRSRAALGLDAERVDSAAPSLPVRECGPLRRPGRDRPARLRARPRGARRRRGRRALRARAGRRDERRAACASPAARASAPGTSSRPRRRRSGSPRRSRRVSPRRRAT